MRRGVRRRGSGLRGFKNREEADHLTRPVPQIPVNLSPCFRDYPCGIGEAIPCKMVGKGCRGGRRPFLVLRIKRHSREGLTRKPIRLIFEGWRFRREVPGSKGFINRSVRQKGHHERHRTKRTSDQPSSGTQERGGC